MESLLAVDVVVLEDALLEVLLRALIGLHPSVVDGSIVDLQKYADVKQLHQRVVVVQLEALDEQKRVLTAVYFLTDGIDEFVVIDGLRDLTIATQKFEDAFVVEVMVFVDDGTVVIILDEL